MKLTEFLLARIAEDEAEGRALLRRTQEHELNCEDPKRLGTVIPGWYDWPNVQAVLASVLAECEAKRGIVGMCRDFTDSPLQDPDSVGVPAILGFLALPYADHSDYRDEWKP